MNVNMNACIKGPWVGPNVIGVGGGSITRNYIPDPLPKPLCGYCIEHLIGPYSPSAQERCAGRLSLLCSSLPGNVCDHIAAYAHYWFEP